MARTLIIGNKELQDTIKVRFKGEEYWLLAGEISGRALAYMKHIDEDKNIKPEHVFSDSFAHLIDDGRIMRYGKQIGTQEDLEIIE